MYFVLVSKVLVLTCYQFYFCIGFVWELILNDYQSGSEWVLVLFEVGICRSGDLDLVIIDNHGEKTAVQAKCYADHNLVPVTIIRELVAAKRNHDCILSLLVTTSDLTIPARKEAEKFKVDYWHGALVEHKLRAWGKWHPSKKPRPIEKSSETAAKSEMTIARKEAAAAASMKCKCGAPLVRRKSKRGEEFLGCSKFPSCRHTKAL